MPRRAQTKALIFLRERGGDGVIDKRGKVVAGGERMFAATSDTWQRLITMGLVEQHGSNRIRITPSGMQEAARPARKVHQDTIRKPKGYVKPYPGAE